MKKFLALALFALICTPFAKADGGDPVYNVSGTLTIPGTTTNEVINFSFQATYVFNVAGNGWDLTLLPGSTATGSDAALGALSIFGGASSPQYFGPGGSGGKDANLIGFGDAEGDTFDLYLTNNLFPSDPPPPSILGGYLYSCVSAACDTTYCPPSGFVGCSNESIPHFAVFNFGTVTETVSVATPEPQGIALLFAGLFSIGLLQYRSRRRHRSCNA